VTGPGRAADLACVVHQLEPVATARLEVGAVYFSAPHFRFAGPCGNCVASSHLGAQCAQLISGADVRSLTCHATSLVRICSNEGQHRERCSVVG